ncbi:MAG TPA: hypothetical protein VJL29_08100 [Thermoguttaceae bacterium]|nr:hypothetical protein [Thermoguttaceae bacterium]
MPKKCEHCDFFDRENHLNECPNCGNPLRFTMFAPPGFETEPSLPAGVEPWSERLAVYEEMELPWSMRSAQIGAGIGAYFLISRTVTSVLTGLFLFSGGASEPEEAVVIYLMLAAICYVVGALAGGAVAGAWSINWVPQGIGVGVGVFLTPIIWFIAFPPEHAMSTILFLGVIGVTTVLAVVGAYLGHKVIRPFRYIIS